MQGVGLALDVLSVPEEPKRPTEIAQDLTAHLALLSEVLGMHPSPETLKAIHAATSSEGSQDSYHCQALCTHFLTS